MWKRIRIAILLSILFYVCLTAYIDLNPRWDTTTTVVVHPINMGNDPAVSEYLKTISQKDFDKISVYLSKNASQYRKKNTVINFELGSTLKTPPPLVNEEVASNPLTVGFWSLKFKFYSLIYKKREDWSADTVMYLIYYNEKKIDHLERSTALQRGRIALVNLYGDSKSTETNNVIVAHEALHTFGGQDFYDLNTGIPIFPIGYAEPNKKPLYPQTKAEIMGGYILLNDTDFYIPHGFDEVVINADTAKDLKWIE